MKKYLDIIYFNRKEIIIVLIMITGFIIFNIYNNTEREIEVVNIDATITKP